MQAGLVVSDVAILYFHRSFFQSIVNMIYIHLMNLNSLDLNLLVALDALLGEANVSRAAMRIGLSQPAASHALQRLRDLIGDPLLVRTGARMELTPRAQALRAPLAQALDQVRSLFIADAFDAARSERQFRLMMPDLAVELLMPPLMEKITRQAPNVRIDVVPWRGPAIFTTEFARTIDMVISIGNAFTGFHRQRLYTDSDALAVRRGHLIGALSKQLSLATVTPPLDPGIDEQFMFYPTRAQMDPGSLWLRNIMLGIGREMEREKRKAG